MILLVAATSAIAVLSYQLIIFSFNKIFPDKIEEREEVSWFDIDLKTSTSLLNLNFDFMHRHQINKELRNHKPTELSDEQLQKNFETFLNDAQSYITPTYRVCAFFNTDDYFYFGIQNEETDSGTFICLPRKKGIMINQLISYFANDCRKLKIRSTLSNN